jgi:hypothetical protein
MSVRSSSPPFAHLTFEHEQAATFADYWHSLPKHDLVPSRLDFDPCTQGPILTSYIIHELISPNFIKIRLVGTKHRECFGADVTGRNYLDFVGPERRPKAARAIHLVCSHPCGILARLTTTTETGRVNQNESFALPMRDNDGRARLVYYQSNSTPLPEYRDPEADRIRKFSAARRTFIDIGAGVPTFED